MIGWVDNRLRKWAELHIRQADSIGWPPISHLYQMLKGAGHVQNRSIPASGGATLQQAERHEKHLGVYIAIRQLREKEQAVIAAKYLRQPEPTYRELAEILGLGSKTAGRDALHTAHAILDVLLHRHMTGSDLVRAIEIEERLLETQGEA